MKKLLVITTLAFLSLPFSGAFAQRYSITTVAGNGTGSFSGDGGPATAAELAGPNGIAVDASGNVYIADYLNSRIRKLTKVLGVDNIAKKGLHVKVYPNPSTSGLFTMAVSGQKANAANTLTVYTLTGKKVYNKMLKQSKHDFPINLSSQAAGVYVYKITSAQNKVINSGKLVVK